MQQPLQFLAKNAGHHRHACTQHSSTVKIRVEWCYRYAHGTISLAGLSGLILIQLLSLNSVRGFIPYHSTSSYFLINISFEGLLSDPMRYPFSSPQPISAYNSKFYFQ